MSIGQEAGISVGNFRVETTSNSGHSPEFYAERICERLIQISQTAPPELRAQAFEYREAMRAVILHGIRQAIRSNHTTLIYQLRHGGLEDAANFIWKLGT